MSHRKTRGSKPALRMLLLFYAAMVALPLFTCFAAYSQALHFAIAQEMETQSTMAEIGMERLESSLKDADAYAESLMRLQCFEEYLRMAGTQKNKLTAQMRAVMDVLPALNDPGDILSSCYIYSASSDSILTAQAGYLHLPIYYEGIFSLEGYGYEDWYGDILRDASFSRLLATAAGAKDSTILYSRRLSYGTRNQAASSFIWMARGFWRPLTTTAPMTHWAFSPCSMRKGTSCTPPTQPWARNRCFPSMALLMVFSKFPPWGKA